MEKVGIKWQKVLFKVNFLCINLLQLYIFVVG